MSKLDVGCKYRCRSVQVPPGGQFEFPFESPAGGCIVKFCFQVHDGYAVRFDLTHGGQSVHGESGSSCEGELRISEAGMCSVRWINTFDTTHLLSFSTRFLSYEVCRCRRRCPS